MSASATRLSTQPHAVPVAAAGTSSEGYVSVPVQERVPLLNAVVVGEVRHVKRVFKVGLCRSTAYVVIAWTSLSTSIEGCALF